MKKFNNAEFRVEDIDSQVELYGWIQKRRDMGGIIFADLRDRSGLLQVVFNRKYLKDDFSVAEGLKNEYVVKVIGTISKRSDDMINPKLKTGEIELLVEKLEILNEAESVPFNVYEDNQVGENVGLKYRYLDLRKPYLRDKMIARSKIIKSARNFLEENGFLEIETPILCKSTPEGARDYIVPSRITKGSFYALPQSPQLLKQLLMVSGFEKYYQIARCFRDEDLRADRQPEFTQIDIEMSFVEQNDVIEMCEALIKKIVLDFNGRKLEDFPRITYQEAMEKYGSDKPDTRFEFLLNDITNILKDTSMNVFRSAIENGGIANCLVVKNNGDKYSRNDIDKLIEFTKIYGARGMAWLKYDNDAFSGVIAKNLEDEKLNDLKKQLNISNNDLILIVADKPKVVYQSLGALRLKIARELNLIDDDKLNFLWVTDFPMFEYSETEKRYMSAHHPFTMPKDLSKINDYENCIAQSYDIVVNGYELASGGVRIHNPKVQKEVFKALNISEEEAENKFGFLLEAFKYGAPPHAGIAPGVDRLVMILTKTDNIKDVIAFPKTQSASDLLMGSPSEVSVEQLNDLGITVLKDDDYE